MVENPIRQFVFVQRLTNLLKKAKELSILCDAEIAVIVFSETGKRFEFASTSMQQILSRYNKVEHRTHCNVPSSSSDAGDVTTSSPELNALREDIATLKTTYMRLMGKDLEGLTYEELQQLEYHLAKGMNSVKEKIKEQVLVERLTGSWNQESNLALENVALRKQVEELQRPSRTTFYEALTKGGE